MLNRFHMTSLAFLAMSMLFAQAALGNPQVVGGGGGLFGGSAPATQPVVYPVMFISGLTVEQNVLGELLWTSPRALARVQAHSEFKHLPPNTQQMIAAGWKEIVQISTALGNKDKIMIRVELVGVKDATARKAVAAALADTIIDLVNEDFINADQRRLVELTQMQNRFRAKISVNEALLSEYRQGLRLESPSRLAAAIDAYQRSNTDLLRLQVRDQLLEERAAKDKAALLVDHPVPTGLVLILGKQPPMPTSLAQLHEIEQAVAVELEKLHLELDVAKAVGKSLQERVQVATESQAEWSKIVTMQATVLAETEELKTREKALAAEIEKLHAASPQLVVHPLE